MDHDLSLLPGILVAQPAPQIPSDCCETEGRVVECDGDIDVVECWVCGCRWTEACA